MSFTPLPTPPSTSDPSNFASRADAFLGALPTFQSELNDFGENLNNFSTTSTSVTSNTIGTGSKNFTVETGKSYFAGQSITVARTAAPSNRMIGLVTSYDSNTGALVFESQVAEGAGTFTDWTITLGFSGFAVPADNSVSTAKIQDDSVTAAKLANPAKPQKIFDIHASVSSNELTTTINPFTADFRSNTLTDGTPTSVTLSVAASVVVPNTATLGTTNGVAARLAVLAINNAGTIEAAIVNISGGFALDENAIINTTAIGTSADSASVVYSTNARTGVAYRVVGFIDITEATAGTWSTAPTLVQGAGGEALRNTNRIYNSLSVAAASQTAIDFTGIPSWVKRIQVIFNGLSTNGSSVPIIQLGDAGGIENTGYNSSSGAIQSNTVGSATFTTGFGLEDSGVASFVRYGVITINKLSSNIWVESHSLGALQPAARASYGGGSKSLSDTLTNVRITTVNGTDVIDAGSVNIFWE